MLRLGLFSSTSLPLARVQDGFNRHYYEASASQQRRQITSATTTILSWKIFSEEISGMPGIKPGAVGSGSVNAPLTTRTLCCLSGTDKLFIISASHRISIVSARALRPGLARFAGKAVVARRT